jgi:cysteine-rich repeat protein
VFVNGELALDLGGWHVPQDGTVAINNQSANTYGLADGSVYEIVIFHAERQTEGSTFKLTLSGFNLAPSDCVTDCGDGEVGAGEECDLGPGLNTGEYNGCTSDCRWGPFCGDQIIQDGIEVCDDGVNDGSYGGCAPGCQLGPHCGDSVVQTEYEQCDDGTNAGGYGECAPGCVLGPYCGDHVENTGFEQCDDGNNEDGDGCSAACVLEIVVE